MSGTRNSFSHLTVEKTHTHIHNKNISLLMSHTLFWRMRIYSYAWECVFTYAHHLLPFIFTHTHARTTFSLSQFISTHSYNILNVLSFSHLLYIITIHSTHTHTQTYLMPVRPTESNVRTMIGIRLQVVSIIMIAAFNPYAHHKSNFISSSNSMLSLFAILSWCCCCLYKQTTPACFFCFVFFLTSVLLCCNRMS